MTLNRTIHLGTSWGGGGAPTVVWDTVTFGSNFTFSNQDQDANKTSAGWTSVKAATGKNSGKLYFEETSAGITDYGYIGIADATQGLNSYIADAGGGGTALGKDWRGGNGLEVVGGITLQASTLAPAISPGDVVGFAVDFAAGQIFLSLNNNFAAFKVGSNPATGANPIGTFTPGITLYPAGSAYSSGGTVTLRLAASGTYAYSPPSGYSSWN